MADSSYIAPVEAVRAPAPPTCANCGAVLSGKYCSACGQRVEYHLHSLKDLLAEAAEALTHADSRLWQTLSLMLLHPGLLTQRFLEGHRASYLPPFRLYLVFSVLFFVVVSAIGGSEPAPSARSAPAMNIDVPGRPGDAAGDTHGPLASSGNGIGVDKGQQTDPAVERPAGSPRHDQNATAEGRCESAVGHSLIPGVDRLRQPFVNACLKSQADGGRELRESFIHNLGRAMFFFLPLLAGVMKLLYWRPARSYVTHLLLLVHNHAFVFLLMAIVFAALHFDRRGAFTPITVLVVGGYVGIYLYSSMRRVYAESWWRTMLKFSALSAVYVACAGLTVLLAGLYSAEIV